MLSRAFDRVHLAAVELPEALQTLRRLFSDDPVKLEALTGLEMALRRARQVLDREAGAAGLDW